jgi:hypothetical protein
MTIAHVESSAAHRLVSTIFLRMRDKGWLAAGLLLGLTNLACGSSDDDGGSGSGQCDGAEPRLMGPPSFDTGALVVGRPAAVVLTVPVTRSTERVVVQISQPSGDSAIANGPFAQGNNVQGCVVTVPLNFAGDLAAGQYFPALSVSAAGADGSPPAYVDYSYQAGVSTTNYTLITPSPLTLSDSGIAIPFLEVK